MFRILVNLSDFSIILVKNLYQSYFCIVDINNMQYNYLKDEKNQTYVSGECF